MVRVFVSHASADRALAEELHQWLKDEGHEAFLAQDPRDGVVVGEQWAQRLHQELHKADAVVCVLTSAYQASRWCTAELAIAQSRGSRLLPIVAEPGVTDPLLTSVQSLDLTRDPGAIRPALLKALRQLDGTWPDDRFPFPGLRPFDVDRHQVFFGRDDDVGQLAELLRSPAEHAKGAVLLVVGPSGCGKSSLVRAGLGPEMAGEPGWRTLPPILPGAHPVTALARELAFAARESGLDWTVEHVHHQLDQGGLTGLADELLLAAPGGPRRHLLIVIDQFEELLTQTDPAERVRFAELLRPAPAGPVHVVATMRPEFLDKLLLDPDLAFLATQTYTLRPLRREALHVVIEDPAQLAGMELDDGLVDRLVDDTDSGEALPLLAFTLAQLADGVTRGGRLSSTRYKQLGGVQGALTSQADAALTDAVEAGGRSREEVIAGLLRLVTVDEQGRPTRWRVFRDELPDPVVTELDAFVARRLLTITTDNDTVVISVAHEAFLTAWSPLAEAIAANVSALRARHAVEQAATEWSQHDRPPARLWGGGQLAAVVTDTGARITAGTASPSEQGDPVRRLPQGHRVLVTDRVDLSPTARDFLHASMRRDRSRRRRIITILSVLLILALVAAVVAVVAQRSSEQRLRTTTARELVAQADATRNTDPRTALQLGLAAQRIDPNDATYSSLVSTLTSTGYAGTLTGHRDLVRSVAFSPDGRTLATGSLDRTVILWDLADPARPHPLGQPLTGHTGTVASVAFSPDGRILASTGGDRTTILWDLTDLARSYPLGQPLTGHTDKVGSVAFSPDGRILATGSVDRTAILWDLTDSAQPRPLGPPLTGHTGAVASVAFAPDGRILATGSDDGTAILWDLTDPAQPRPLGAPLTGHTEEVNSVAFAPDGTTLATGSGDATVILWDLTDPAQPRPRREPLKQPGQVYSVTFSPAGNTLAVSGFYETVMLFELTDPAQPFPYRRSLAGHRSSVNSVAFAPDGRTLASAGGDRTAILWDLTDPAAPHRLGRPLTGHTNDVQSLAFSPDGNTLATASFDQTVILWDLTDPTQPRPLGQPLTGHSKGVSSVAFSPDGRILATAGFDGTVILWDLADPTQPRPLSQPLSSSDQVLFTVTFSPNGRILATAGYDGTVILWDLTDPAQPRRLGEPLTGHSVAVTSVVFSPNGRILATSSFDGTVILRDVSDPAQPRTLGQPLIGRDQVWSVAFSPDGTTLAAGSSDETGLLWDVTDPARPHPLGRPLTEHTNLVRSVAFSPDETILATGSFDRTVILWDLTDPAQPRTLGQPLTDHTVGVTSVAFSPNGRVLATASGDRTVILWDVTELRDLRSSLRAHAVQRACSVTGGGLDRAEWNRRIPDLPYQDSCPG